MTSISWLPMALVNGRLEAKLWIKLARPRKQPPFYTLQSLVRSGPLTLLQRRRLRVGRPGLLPHNSRTPRSASRQPEVRLVKPGGSRLINKCAPPKVGQNKQPSLGTVGLQEAALRSQTWFKWPNLWSRPSLWMRGRRSGESVPLTWALSWVYFLRLCSVYTASADLSLKRTKRHLPLYRSNQNWRRPRRKIWSWRRRSRNSRPVAAAEAYKV